MPSFDQLKVFLEQRCRAWEATTNEKGHVKGEHLVRPQSYKNNKANTAIAYQATLTECQKCKGQHQLFRCPEFLKLTIPERIEWVRVSTLCFNCLKGNHNSKDCRSSACKICNKSHNTLLHRETKVTTGQTSQHHSISNHHATENSNGLVIMATAQAKVADRSGAKHIVRALLDSASEASFITESCVRRLQLHRIKSNINITGIGLASAGTSMGVVELKMSSSNIPFEWKVKAIILPTISNSTPRTALSQSIVDHIANTYNLHLADPQYHKSNKIDMLIGADWYYNLIIDGQLKDTYTNLSLQNTKLGWVIAGSAVESQHMTEINAHLAIQDISEQLQQFWNQEELPAKALQSEEDVECEQHFQQTYSRNSEGRFIVKLPFNKDLINLGDTKQLAERRLRQMEKRLHANPEHRQQYTNFMVEYEQLNHMQLAPEKITSTNYYLPHHSVIREQSTTTKLRVVFDGSAQPQQGLSLNQTLMVGPKQQDDLVAIVLRFRMNNIAYTADLEKMYRQVEIHPEHYKYQHILWRQDTQIKIQEYELKTLTYGTASAPFLAVRCLRKLAELEQSNYPLASAVILNDFYVDDLISGTNTIQEAVEIQEQLIELLHKAQFNLHKWTCSQPELMAVVPPACRNQSKSMTLAPAMTKTLGICWDSIEDTFKFDVKKQNQNFTTKRSILSSISKLFDPLGWLAPTTVIAKVIIQKIWLAGIGWDDKVPEDIHKNWSQYLEDLPTIQQFSLPRQMILNSVQHNYLLLGFCDASQEAYGATIYIRSTYQNQVISNLVCSKSRVAPLKQISLPRLELCGALMLARLMHLVSNILGAEMNQLKAWTDSTITLSWIQRPARTWKTFVANRVAELQELLPPNHWKHVRSEQNPADCLTRGMFPSQLKNHGLWWNGPKWIELPEHQWPISEWRSTSEEVEAKVAKARAVHGLTTSVEDDLLHRYSSWTTLIRITAYCLRFMYNCTKSKDQRIKTFLTTNELSKAEKVWIRKAQEAAFSQELKQCKLNQPVVSKSPVAVLLPFVDKEGVLRVGGRLRLAQLSYHQKHQIILPTGHQVTTLIIRNYHDDYLHASSHLLVSVIRNKYWILRAKSTIRRLIHSCTKCFRNKIHTSEQLMGDLPKNRITPARPFSRCGIDYAGPIVIKAYHGRGNIRKSKAYICLFVCFVTKAIHLELAGDLSTQTFIAALRRFVSRRGKPSDIYSDCGTNFIRANKELKELYQLITSKKHNDNLTHKLANQGITWHFNPPAAPHFGGLWEAGIKSTKYHLRRTIGLTILTYEELNTLLTQIESCLNSRPLCQLSEDPHDLEALTPAHFLVGEPLEAIPQQDLNVSLTTRWQLVQKIMSQFWSRWSKEYLMRLQQRPKWTKKMPNLKEGELVLLRVENVSSLQWPLARVIHTHEGQDGLVRAVTVKTSSGMLKRPIMKCYRLPLMENQPGAQLLKESFKRGGNVQDE